MRARELEQLDRRMAELLRTSLFYEAMQAEAAWQTRDQARRLTRHDQKPIAE
jgi:hypothetical protein